MKISYLRAGAAALACALALGACGGSSGSLLLGGTAVGVTKDGLILQNNGSHDFAVGPAQLDANSMYFFPDLIGTDESFNVTVKQAPPNTDGCIVQNPKGRSAYNVTNVNVICTLKLHTLAMWPAWCWSTARTGLKCRPTTTEPSRWPKSAKTSLTAFRS
jgi:hypothetical protein